MTDYTLIQGDCLEVMPTLEKGSVAMVFADLPYATAKRQSTANSWDRPFPLDKLWPQLLRLGTKRTAYVFTAIQPFASELLMSNRAMFRYDLIFHKSSPVGFFNANRQPMRAHEHVLIFYRKSPNYTPQFTSGGKPYGAVLRKGSKSNYGVVQPNARPANFGRRHPTSVLAIRSEGRTISKHPTQKPVALLEWLIASYTQPGDVIFDPAAGSGSTGVACARLGRKFLGIEKDKAYYVAADARVRLAYASADGVAPQSRLAI